MTKECKYPKGRTKSRASSKPETEKYMVFDFKWFNETDYDDMSLPPDVAVDDERMGQFLWLSSWFGDSQILKGERDQLELKQQNDGSSLQR